MNRRISAHWSALTLVFLVACCRLTAGFLSWDFELKAPSSEKALQREIDVEITTPSGRVLRLPAFAKTENQFSVRCFDEAPGRYSVEQILEAGVALAPESYVLANGKVLISEAKESQSEHFIRISTLNTRQFSRGTEPFLPTGANLPWALGEPAEYYRKNLEGFSAAGLNWARVWMAHWSGMNLEWPSTGRGAQEIGTINPEVARLWDVIVETAEQNGVALQVVLQHHGQVSRGTDANWNDNPWNAANPGGFLRNPEDFFSDARARKLTKAKYRYIVARWGYSPAIMAWELFNEIHNTEVYKEVPGGKELLAAWHSEMARHLRRIDAYRHLITTSCEEFKTPLYQEMDYLQPHCYATNMLSGPRRLAERLPGDARPAFYGEIGDDQLRLSDEQRRSGIPLLAPAWASAFGDSEQPGQTWYVERLVDSGRLAELGSVGKFLRHAEVWKRSPLTPFTAAVTSSTSVPWSLLPSNWWSHDEEATVSIMPDGREPQDLSRFPKVLVGNSMGRRAGYPHAVTFDFNFPQATTVTIAVEKAASQGGRILGALDGARVFDKEWLPEGEEAMAKPDGPFAATHPASVRVPVPAGSHQLRLFNEGARDWIQLSKVDIDLPQAGLGAMGKHNENFVMLWIWRRPGVAQATVDGRVELPDLAQGRWHLVRWNARKGIVEAEEHLEHSGGLLQFPVTLSDDYTACFLEKE